MSLLFVLLSAIIYDAPPADDRVQCDALVNRFVVAIAASDLEAAMECWSKHSTQYAEIRGFLKSTFARFDKVDIADLKTSRWKVLGTSAQARLLFKWTFLNKVTHAQSVQKAAWDVEFVKEKASWRLMARKLSQIELLNSLIKAKSKEERQEIFDNEKELLTKDIVTTLGSAVEDMARSGKHSEAHQMIDVAFEVAESLIDSKEHDDALAWCHNYRAAIYLQEGKYKEAGSSLDQAVLLFAAVGNVDGRAVTLNNKGALLVELNDFEQALTTFAECVTAAKDANDEATEARAHVNLGELWIRKREYPKAYEEFAQCQELAKGLNGRARVLLYAQSMSGMGQVFFATGKYSGSLAHYDESLNAYKDLEMDIEAAKVLHRKGIVLAIVGDLEMAEKASFDAFLTLIKSKLKEDALASLLDCGSIRYLMGNVKWSAGARKEAYKKYNDAATLLELSRKLAIDEKLSKIAAQASGMRGVVKDTVGLHEEAISDYLQARKFYEELDDKRMIAGIDVNLGTAYQLTGDLDKAIECYERSLSGFNRYEINEAGLCWTGIGEVRQKQKRWEEAVSAYDWAIKCIELARSQTRQPFLQISYFSSKTSPYHGLVDCLIELGKNDRKRIEQAFAVSERAKSRTLAEMIAGSRSPLPKASGKDRETWDSLNGKIRQLIDELHDAPADRRDDLEKQLADARRERDEFQSNLFNVTPHLRDQQAQFEPVTLKHLDATLFSKTPNLCVLSYVVSDDKVILFAISRDENGRPPARITAYRIPITDENLYDQVRAFRSACANTGHEFNEKEVARELYGPLLGTVAENLVGKDHLIIIPDGPLFSLPFQALVDSQGHFVIESHAVSYAPSVTALDKMISMAHDKVRALNDTDQSASGQTAEKLRILAMGHPEFPQPGEYTDLPASKVEAEKIAAFFGSKAFTEAEATEKKAKQLMNDVSHIHFATHGTLKGDAPFESFVVLAAGDGEDGYLHASELFELDLRAEMTVLSACKTAEGQTVNGEGVLGFSWALFIAGSPTCLLTQWEVHSDTTSSAMVEFYRRLFNEKDAKGNALSKSEALRRTQRDMISKAEYKHPYYWAPFTLIGDGLSGLRRE